MITEIALLQYRLYCITTLCDIPILPFLQGSQSISTAKNLCKPQNSTHLSATLMVPSLM